MSCLRHPAGAHLRLGRHYQQGIKGRRGDRGPGCVRRGRLPCRHRPRRGHQRQRRTPRRRRVHHHGSRIRCGSGISERPRPRMAIGVEGTASYGAGFTGAARSHGHQVVEVNRPDRAERRRIGRSDPIDAYAAARAALSGRAQGAPKDETVAGIRALHNAARSAVKARAAALNQITHHRAREHPRPIRTAQRDSPHRRPGPAAADRGRAPRRGPHRTEEPRPTRQRTDRRARGPHQGPGQRGHHP
ncbi:transposase [Streptomyces sp. NPDC057424]|uniref:IS110 family transposase n=1 Tax=Streptomyces sp. NPDC057424 TaxID=3346127 RepID=UPI003683F28D